MNLLAWPLTFLALAFMYPWTRRLLEQTHSEPTRHSQRSAHRISPILLGMTTLALSIGVLTLVMLWMGLLGILIDWRLATAICAAISAVGWGVFFAAHRDTPPLNAKNAEPSLRLVKGSSVWRWMTVLIGVIAGLILFNAVWWPFGIGDAVTIYAGFGKVIARSAQLPRGALYEAYPMMIPLAYAFTHQAAGWTNEYLAALIPGLLSVGVLGVAYELGRELFDKATGMFAALLIALTPIFAFWASASYVDLPAGFFYGLAAVYLARLARTENWRDALLAGIMAGLAAWTKNSALLIVLSVGLWFLYRWWVRWQRDLNLRVDLKMDLRHMAPVALGFLAVAAPWYLRNLVLDGLIIPPTGWIDQAERTPLSLLPYLTDNRYFVMGVIFTAGLVFAVWQSIRALLRATNHPPPPDYRPVFLTIFYLPFFAIWWLLFSYDGRFLLTLAPIVAVMSGHLLVTLIRQLELREIAPGQRAQRILAIFVILLALPAASTAISFKTELIRNPLMSDADRHRVRLGTDRYNMALYLRTLPAGSHVWVEDILLPYQADGVGVVAGLFPAAAQLKGFDYWVLSPGEVLPTWLDPSTLVHSEGDYRLYKLPQS